MSPLTIAALTVHAAALAWKGYQLWRAPHDRPLRAITLCIACALLGFLLGNQPGMKYVDAATSAGAGKLLQNILALCTVYWLMCFYLYSGDPRCGPTRARRALVPLVVTVVVITWATLATPEYARGRSYAAADMRVTGVAVFYLVAGLYLVYALTTALRWTLPYARASRRPLSTGLWLAAAGMGGMVLGVSVRSVAVVIRWQGETVPTTVTHLATLIIAAAIPLFVVGVSHPAVSARLAALRLWWHHRRMYARLRPLWALLHQAFPQDALARVPTSRWADALRLRGVHRRYYRRVIECRDGLVRVSPYLHQLAPEDRAVGTTGTGSMELAGQLRAALARQGPAAPPAAAVAVAVPDGQEGLEADVRQLAALADALKQS